MAITAYDDVRILIAAAGHLIAYKIQYLNIIQSSAGTFLKSLTLVPHNDMPRMEKLAKIRASNDLHLSVADFVQLIVNPLNKHEGFYQLKKSHTLLPLAKGDLLEVSMQSHHELYVVDKIRASLFMRLLRGAYHATHINKKEPSLNLSAIGTTQYGWAKVLTPKFDLIEVNKFFHSNHSMVIRLPENEPSRPRKVITIRKRPATHTFPD